MLSATLAATLGVVLSLTIVINAWRDQQQQLQAQLEKTVNAQVSAVDQQLKLFDGVLSEVAQLLQQRRAEDDQLFTGLTENMGRRLPALRFIAFYRSDENNNLRLTEVTPKDTLDLRTGASLLRVLPNAGREMWADARQWRSHFIVQLQENRNARLNVLYPVVSRVNQFDAAQLLGVLHMGIDIERFVSSSLHHAAAEDVYLTIVDVDENNGVIFSNIPEDAQSELNSERNRHSEYSLLTGGLNWRLHFYAMNPEWLTHFAKQQMGSLLALVLSIAWLTMIIFSLRRFNRLQLEQQHAESTLTHTRVLLQQTETELDNFSYCVSHDLRAPLRHIRSYSQILLLDHGSQLDDEGKLLSQRIADSGAKMSRLIDDLLRLSRVSRSPIKFVPCDLSELVSSVYVELRQEFAQLDVRFKCEPAITVVADPTLLRIALSCLLHNALKYSSKKVLADIQFGIDLNTPGETAYFIRDNGSGFDMRYVDRLFAPFNRLHGEDDFGGTGIGLATAKRVILRHGGRIWVKSVPNEGTTMFFTLPPPHLRIAENLAITSAPPPVANE